MSKTQNAALPHEPAAQERQILPMEFDVRIHSIRPNGSCRATASVDINGGFAVRGVKVMESSKGLFVSMPGYKAGNGEYKDICFPCTKETRQQFSDAVLNAYQQTLTMGMRQTQQAAPDPTLRQAQPTQELSL